MSDHPHQAKSQRRIYRALSHWTDVSAIVVAGGKPDLDDIIFLLRLGEAVPPDVQACQIESDQWRSARTLYDAIDGIRTARCIPLARSFKVYVALKKGPDAKSVEREYRAAKKLLLADIEHLNTPTHRWFLSRADVDDWLRKDFKKRKNK